MNILSCSKLNEKQRDDISKLMASCKKYEPITMTFPMTNEDNDNKEMDCFYLLYEKKNLISAATLFMPDSETCEIMGFTYPRYRGRGAFSKILGKVEEAFEGNDDKESPPHLRSAESMTFVFMADGNSVDAKKAIDALGGAYWYSEYVMELELIPEQGGNCPKSKIRLSIEVEEANLQEEDGKEILYYAYLGNDRIGSCSVSLTSTFTYLYGLYIEEGQRGQGYGREFFEGILKDLEKRGIVKASLQVSSQNKIPLYLYDSLGFLVVQKLDYFVW